MSLSTVAEKVGPGSGEQTPVLAAPQPAQAAPPPPVDTGLPSLALVANFHKLACDVDQVRHEMGLGTKPCSSVDIVRASKLVKLKARRLTRQPA